jgi:hypothetical protein
MNVLKLPWRIGRKLERTIYAMLGKEPSEDDLLIGVMDEKYIAQHVVDVHNASLERGNSDG